MVLFRQGFEMYSRYVILRELRRILRSRPRQKLAEIAREIGVERHTILRVLSDKGLDFRSMSCEYVCLRVQEFLQTSPPLTMKEIAFRIGFPSLSSFSHYLARHKEWSPRISPMALPGKGIQQKRKRINRERLISMRSGQTTLAPRVQRIRPPTHLE